MDLEREADPERRPLQRIEQRREPYRGIFLELNERGRVGNARLEAGQERAVHAHPREQPRAPAYLRPAEILAAAVPTGDLRIPDERRAAPAARDAQLPHAAS